MRRSHQNKEYEMNKTTEALKLCLEALPNILFAATERDKKNRIRMFDNCVYQAQEALDVGREALAEQDKQEPVAWRWKNGNEWLNQYTYLDNGAPDCPELCEPLYAAPVQQVELTVSDLDAIIEKHYDDEMDLKAMILDGIAAFKEKNK
jgi:hypothetical protein